MPEAFRVVIPESTPPYFKRILPFWFFFAFLTGVKLLPGIPNNIGPFEICGAIVVSAWLLVETKAPGNWRHPLIAIIGVMLALAAISLVKLPQSRLLTGFIQLLILLFLVAFLLVMRHFIERYAISPDWLLGIISPIVLIVAIWVYFDGLDAVGGIQAAGPFRNRAHMATYMLTAFWLAFMQCLWPGLRWRSRMLAYTAAGLALYLIAVSGRRSVYLSLFLGLTALTATLVFSKKGRLRFALSALLAILVLGGLYRFAEDLGPRATFFRARVGLIDDRLKSTLATAEAGEQGFFALQREGVSRAFRDSPIIGIGWGGFPKSEYSPTGHEVHSTPLRFLAELGLLGLALYLVMIGFLLRRSLALFMKMRRTPYGTVFSTLWVATWSLTISYLYNRHITERTFWIFLATFLALELFASRWHRLNEEISALSLDQPARASHPRHPRPQGVGEDRALAS